MSDVTEFRFRVRYVESAGLHPRPAPSAKKRTKWGSASAIAASKTEAEAWVRHGYRNLGHKVLKVEDA